MGIITIKDVLVAYLRMPQQDQLVTTEPAGTESVPQHTGDTTMSHKSVKECTLSFSCVSLTVLPSDFFLQSWPSFLKNLTDFLLNRKREPPASTNMQWVNCSSCVEVWAG